MKWPAWWRVAKGKWLPNFGGGGCGRVAMPGSPANGNGSSRSLSPSPCAKSMYLRGRREWPINGQVSRYTRIPELPARTGAFSSFPSTLDPWPGTYVSGAAGSQRAQLTLFHYDNFVSLEYLCQSHGRAVPRRRRDIIMGSHFQLQQLPSP